MKNLLLAGCLCLASSLAFSQQTSESASPNTSQGASQTSQGMSGDMHDMKGMDMSGHDMSKMSGSTDADESGAMHSMESHHMDMGPHMKMTALRAPQPGDAERAQKVVLAARDVMEKYKDYHTALDEGFHIFHPEIPQKAVSLHQLPQRICGGVEVSTLKIRLRCSTKKRATAIGSSASCTPLRRASQKTILTSAFR